MEEREREGGGDGAGSSSSAGASAALLLVIVVVAMQEEGGRRTEGRERDREGERLRVAEKLFGLLRNETKRNASPVPIYMRQSINRACVAPTQSYPFVVRRRLRGLLARISPLGVPASAQGVD